MGFSARRARVRNTPARRIRRYIARGTGRAGELPEENSCVARRVDVHGDSHVYRLGTNWPGVSNLIELQTFAVNDTDRWVEVTVDPTDPRVFRFAKMQS